MAVRVRKLAKEIQRTPAQTLGLLHHLGFPRFKSPEDMVADQVASRVRSAASQGVRAAPVQPQSVRKATPAVEAAAQAEPDLMARLVPGVVPVGSTPLPPARGQPVPAEAEPAGAPEALAEPQKSPQPRSNSTEVDELEQHVARLESEHKQQAAALAAAEQALERAERARQEAVAGHADLLEKLRVLEARLEGAVTLSELLDERGLVGRDEHARAVAALVHGRHLDLDKSEVSEPEVVRQVLRERLILVDHAVPSGLTRAVAVEVSQNRAELGGVEHIEDHLGRIGEKMVLLGWKRLTAFGVAPRWHGVLRQHLDHRITVAFRPKEDLTEQFLQPLVDQPGVVWALNLEVESSLEGLLKESGCGYISHTDTITQGLQHLLDWIESV